jgi:peptidoglycan-associated lipoprotein
MKLQSVALIAITLALASCKCTTSDSSKVGGSGFGACAGTGKGDIIGSDRVFFAFDQSALSDGARETLDNQAKWLLSNPGKKIQVVGHCDSRGTSEYNIALGERRANAAKEYLVQLGVPSARITVTSVGKEQPVVQGENEAAWAQNRTAITIEQ